MPPRWPRARRTSRTAHDVRLSSARWHAAYPYGTLAPGTQGTPGTIGTLSLWRWWFAPIAAGVTAATLWMVVPEQPQLVSKSHHRRATKQRTAARAAAEASGTADAAPLRLWRELTPSGASNENSPPGRATLGSEQRRENERKKSRRRRERRRSGAGHEPLAAAAARRRPRTAAPPSAAAGHRRIAEEHAPASRRSKFHLDPRSVAHRRRSHRALRQRRHDWTLMRQNAGDRDRRRLRAVQFGVLVRRRAGTGAADGRCRRDVHARQPCRAARPREHRRHRRAHMPPSTRSSAAASAPTMRAAPGGPFRPHEAQTRTETAEIQLLQEIRRHRSKGKGR